MNNTQDLRFTSEKKDREFSLRMGEEQCFCLIKTI